MTKFTFRNEDIIDGKDITFALTYDECTPWPTILQDFLFFLEGVGYEEVRNKVRLEYSPFREGNWHGEYYDNEEEDINALEKEYEEENK